MKKIINIDGEKCDGCGLCVEACHEGAIQLIEGKAALVNEEYCDGLGDCLPACPAGAITLTDKIGEKSNELPCGCPSSHAKELTRENETAGPREAVREQTQLRQWPVQIKLVSSGAKFFNGADLLVAADCAAYAYGNFHSEYMRGKITLIGCPKLDGEDYSEKLAEILIKNEIKSVTAARMDVPCCAGIVNAVRAALQKSGKIIPCSIVTVTTDGKINKN
ncbi:MAG: 4Fe-4S binding protein [Defluviitaleaceae bacterium]|nr:4Fe-4S binding protein [Defluviitaleaceae bacterium]